MGETNENGINGVETSHIENGENGINVEAPEVKKFTIPTAKLKDVVVTDYMKNCIDIVAKAEGFNNYEFNVVHGSAIGDGFVGLLFKVTLHERDSDKQLTLVLKTPPENEAKRIDFGAMGLFEREVLVYNEVLPAFVQFQEEKRISKAQGFFDFPKCYFAEYNVEKDDSIIIMEDLKENGYKLYDKFTPTNYEHTKLLVTALGKLHAISFAMKAQKPEVFDKFKTLDDFMSIRIGDERFIGMLNSNIDKAAATLDDGDKRKNRVLAMKDDVGQLMKDMVNPSLCEPYAVVTHGDCWSNNFMYRYRRGKPEKIVLLDWQISRYCSPILDLVYFFFTCTDQEMRTKHYDELLSIYHRSLKDLLDHLGGDTMTQFPFTAFLRQLKLFGKFGILMATMLIPMLTTRNEDLPDMDFIAEKMKEANQEELAELMKTFSSTENDACKPRLRGSIQDALRYRYL